MKFNANIKSLPARWECIGGRNKGKVLANGACWNYSVIFTNWDTQTKRDAVGFEVVTRWLSMDAFWLCSNYISTCTKLPAATIPTGLHRKTNILFQCSRPKRAILKCKAYGFAIHFNFVCAATFITETLKATKLVNFTSSSRAQSMKF